MVFQGNDRADVLHRADALLRKEDCWRDPECVWLGLLALTYADGPASVEFHLDSAARSARGQGSRRHHQIIMLARAHAVLLSGDATRARLLLETLLRECPRGPCWCWPPPG